MVLEVIIGLKLLFRVYEILVLMMLFGLMLFVVGFLVVLVVLLL